MRRRWESGPLPAGIVSLTTPAHTADRGRKMQTTVVTMTPSSVTSSRNWSSEKIAEVC